MATLIKANNSTALYLAGSWSPAQIPTSVDILSFTATYIRSTASVLSIGGTLNASKLVIGAVTGGTNANDLTLGITTAPAYPVAVDYLDLSNTSLNFNLYTGVSSNTANLDVFLRSGYTMLLMPGDTNVTIRSTLETGTPNVSLSYPPSDPGTVNYQLGAATTSITVGANEDALISFALYPLVNCINDNTAVITGHPTLPTAITIQQSSVTSGSYISSTSSVSTSNGIASSITTFSGFQEDSAGNIYVSTNASTTRGYCFVRYNPSTQKIVPTINTLGAGALIKDLSGNLIVLQSAGTAVPVVSSTYGPEYGIGLFNPTTNQWSSIGGGFPSATVIRAAAVDASGNIYVGGTFSATRSGVSATNIARFNASTGTWSALGTGCNASVHALTMVGNDLFVGGQFTTAGGVSARYVAKWTPSTSTWSNVGISVGQYPTSLVYDSVGNRVYAASNLGAMGPSSTSSITVFNPTTSTWSNLVPSVNLSSCTSLVLDSTARRLYCGFSASGASGQVQYYNLSALSWTNIGVSGFNSGVLALFKDSTNQLWIGGNGTASNVVGVSAQGVLKWNTNTSVFSVMTYVDQFVPIMLGFFNIYAGSNTSGTLLLSHGAGKSTYVVAPNTTVCIQVFNGAGTNIAGLCPPGVIRIRRGGALLESPTISTDSGVFLTQRTLLDHKIGGNTSSFVTWASGAGGSYPSLRTSSNESRIFQTTSVLSQYLALKADGPKTVIFSRSTATLAVVGKCSPDLTLSGVLINPTPIVLGMGATITSSQYGKSLLLGEPRTISNVTISRSLNLGSPYVRVSGNITVDSAKPTFYAPSTPFSVPFLVTSGNTYKVVEWTTSSGPLIVGTNSAEIRVPNFNNIEVLGSSIYSYSGAGSITITKPMLPSSNSGQGIVVVMEPGSGLLTLNTFYQPSNPFVNVRQQVSIYNSGTNVFTGDISPTRAAPAGSMNVLYVSGKGILSIDVYLGGSLTVFQTATATLNFAAGTAPSTDIVHPYAAYLDVNAGTLQLKGAPGQNNSQYSAQMFYGGTSGNAYLEFVQNGANSLSLSVASMYLSYPIFVRGLSGACVLTTRTNSYVSNGLLTDINTNTPALVVLGSSPGIADFGGRSAANTPENIAIYAGYTGTLPTSGGSGSANYTLTSSLTLTGNVSAFGVKVTQSTNADVLDLSTFTFSPRTLLITGAQGGTYTISGPAAATTGLSAYNVINCSTAELQILSTIRYAAVYLGGPGIISLGSPTTTYRSSAGWTGTFAIAASEARLYAGTDNQNPFLQASGYSFTILAGSTLRLMGAGTGRNIDATYILWSGAKLQVDEDWEGLLTLSTSPSDYVRRYEVNVAQTKTFTVSGWNTGSTGRLQKTGEGTLRFLLNPASTVAQFLVYVEQGTVELYRTTPITNVYSQTRTTPFELLSGTSLIYNSSVEAQIANVTWGAGQVIKNNTGTMRVNCRNSFTGGFTVNNGEWDAQYRYAVGDGNVTLNGGTLRASDVETDPYVLEVAGNLVFAGGVLVIGAAYVA